MYADDYSSQITAPSPVRRPTSLAAFPCAEERYREAKTRLSAAQQEKLEAALEFLAAREALSRWMEELWPGQEG